MPCNAVFSDKIEILGLDIFDTHRDEIEIVKKYCEYFDAALGWHYYLDLAWILKGVSTLPKGSLLLDAGAGSGILQFILADMGFNVISADFMGRDFSKGYAGRYAHVIHSLNSQKNSVQNSYTNHLKTVYASCGNGLLHNISRYFKMLETKLHSPDSNIEDNLYVPGTTSNDSRFDSSLPGNIGRIFLYKCDIGNMPLLTNNMIDGVVSVSALEHNSRAGFEKCMTELLRVTKPSGSMFITVSAALDDDYYHEPSKGWCYSEKTLMELFRLSTGTRSNFCQSNELYNALKSDGNELQKRLSRVYFESGENGMPWGKWNPQYQPVGIVKVVENV
jgi:ubiquinone/menaquinone biosynthesis C-methylase UbiE